MEGKAFLGAAKYNGVGIISYTKIPSHMKYASLNWVTENVSLSLKGCAQNNKCISMINCEVLVHCLNMISLCLLSYRLYANILSPIKFIMPFYIFLSLFHMYLIASCMIIQILLKWKSRDTMNWVKVPNLRNVMTNDQAQLPYSC